MTNLYWALSLTLFICLLIAFALIYFSKYRKEKNSNLEKDDIIESQTQYVKDLKVAHENEIHILKQPDGTSIADILDSMP